MNYEDALSLFEAMTAPVESDLFMGEIVGKRPVAVLGSDDDAQAMRFGLIGDDPKATILDAYRRHATELTCHIAEPKVPPPEPRAVAGPEEFQALVKEYHAAEYTVRIPQASQLSPQLARFIRALEYLFSGMADTVVFWSGQGAEAPVHDDEYDVIAIQLLGKKKWYVSREEASLRNPWRIGTPVPEIGRKSEIDVEPGDMLYLPRGTVHTVSTPSEESIHLSIAFNPVTVRDAMQAALDYLSDEERFLRENASGRGDAVARGGAMAPLEDRVREGLDRLVEAAKSDDFIRTAMRYRQSRLIGDMPKLDKGKPVMVDPDTIVRHSPTAVAALLVNGEHVDFAQPGEHILVNAAVEQSLRFIADHAQFRVGDIPGPVDDQVRVALVQRLIASGFLVPDA
ncbi:JmjC domain-containing protein [Sphingomicrobium marinum]|uniref:JmjC domain-containing protein n=1 Tax=Sphingomicrobium marinum TaxID=1227950 RepID=UPI002240D8F7|nr:cupin domain-containing protein [Sphingomicrobium marinum]